MESFNLTISRLFDAPRDLVWRAWTDPVRIADWFAIPGFTMAFGEFDLRPGGKWLMAMRSPDGVDYELPRTFREIIAPRRLVFTDQCTADGKLFFDAVTTIIFEDIDGKTKLTVSAETNAPSTAHDVEQWSRGWSELFDRFASYAGRLQKPDVELYFTRVFDAPRELVFKVWTDPTHLAHWWGPKDFTNPICDLDMRPGGRIRIDMTDPDGSVYPMTGTVHEVTAPERLVFTAVAEDLDGNPLLESLTIASFVEQGGKTKLIVKASAFGLTPLGKDYLKGMEEGWTQSLGRLTDLIDAIKVSGREIVITRLFDAPRQLVFDTFIDHGNISRWWGPNGFTTTTHKSDFRVGGGWRFTMHGPDGTDYPNYIAYTKIEKPKLIAYDHLHEEGGPLHFKAVVAFAEENGKTRVTLRLMVDSAETRDGFVKFGAVEGGYQTLDRLAAYLSAARN
jgi:uncharacterized protein YndB with AHSA1/START domain